MAGKSVDAKLNPQRDKWVLSEYGQSMQFLKADYRISMPMSQGSITPIASSATAIHSGGRLPLPIPFRIAMISATNAQRDVIGGITGRSLLDCVQMVSCPSNAASRAWLPRTRQPDLQRSALASPSLMVDQNSKEDLDNLDGSALTS
jgi:hypothetical protein